MTEPYRWYVEWSRSRWRLDHWYRSPPQWKDHTMTRKTYRVELIVDGDDEVHEVIRPLLRETARVMYTQAALVCSGGREPQIAMHADDFFDGPESLGILDRDEEQPEWNSGAL